MKKLLKVFFMMAMVVSLVACGGKDDSAAQKKVVNRFFDDLKAMEIKDMKDYMSDEAYEDTISLTQSMNDIFMNLDDAEIYGEAFTDGIKDLVDYVFSQSFKDMKITKIKEENGKAIVTVKGNRIDFEGIENPISDEEIQVLVLEALSDETIKNEMSEIFNSEGEEAAMKYLLEKVSPKMFTKFKEVIDSSEYTEYVFTLDLAKEDGKWIIDSLR